jgi:hypothetical protein
MVFSGNEKLNDLLGSASGVALHIAPPAPDQIDHQSLCA